MRAVREERQMPDVMPVGIARVTVRRFRTARHATLTPGQLCALVGLPNAGKSNILTAIWSLLNPSAPPFTTGDASSSNGGTEVEALLHDGRRVSLRERARIPSLFLPADLRRDGLVAGPPPRDRVARRVAQLMTVSSAGSPRPRDALLRALESCAADARGLVFIMEEPELFLRPQTQRYLYRLLIRLSSANQVIYSTHSPAFLSVARLEDLAFVVRDPVGGTQVVQPHPIEHDTDFRIVSEFDAERSELFLARAVVLVEGMTEKLILPLVFAALGHDADLEAISIIECGGKSNIPLFARICKATGIPCVAMHDRDAPHGSEPILAEQELNALISTVVGRERTVVLEPDFEGVAGLHGSRNKPERAWKRFARIPPEDVPEPLARAARLAVALARD